MEPRILVVYFSRTGSTRSAAEDLANELPAELEELHVASDYSGLRGYLRAGFEAAVGRSGMLIGLLHDPAAYDLVVVGTPVWNNNISSPVRTYLTWAHGRLRNVAFFATQGGTRSAHTFAEMAEVSGLKPLAQLSMQAGDVERGRHIPALTSFARTLKERLLVTEVEPVVPRPSPPRVPGEHAMHPPG